MPRFVRALLSRQEQLAPALMVAPAALFSVLMVGFPFGYAAYLALTDFRLASTVPATFVGLGNFIRAFQDPVFHRALQVTLTIYVVALSLEVVLGTYAGILLGQKLRGVGPLRMLAFAPAVIPSVAVGLIFVQMYDPAQGLMNYLLKTVGLKPQPWLSDPRTVVPSIILVEVWQWTPFITLIVTGAMQSLPTEPFESALIDGASSFQILRYVTLPLLRPAIIVAAMLRTVDLMRIFDSIYIMTQGGPVNASMSLNVYAFTQGILFSQIGYASSIMLVLLCMVLLTSGLFSIIRARSTL
ncbi:MAG: carbohydrate ABC transporter permease [Anaerolineae bacterium]